MPVIYRVFFRNDLAHPDRPSVDFACDGDDQARTLAHQYRGTADVELWRGGHLIAMFARQYDDEPAAKAAREQRPDLSNIENGVRNSSASALLLENLIPQY